ncbi:MAG: gliding motility-associated lipoprotein GldH [Paraglaciecola sp.]|jgi:gliding motility-associated lipoprotein GldH
MFQKLSVFLLAFTLFSCGKSYLYNEEIAILNDAWTDTDSLNFQFNIPDTSKIYNILLDVEHSPEYAFQNMYVEIYTAFPSGERIKEMISLELANRAGVWYSDCGSSSCALEIPIQEGAFFNQAGDYEITIKQFMRKNPLEGVQGMGLKIEDTGNVR